jgi:hypothetical protein
MDLFFYEKKDRGLISINELLNALLTPGCQHFLCHIFKKKITI